MGPSTDPPGRLSGNFSQHKLGITVGGVQAKNKYSVRQYRICCAHKKRCETRYICGFCVVTLRKGPF